MLKFAESDNEIEKCFDVMVQLRPNLDRQNFSSVVTELMSEGYRLAYIERDTEVVCVAGFKIQNNLFLGKHLYIEDLVTSESARSSGLGNDMMNSLRELARMENCCAVDLDSGVQRHKAHKFYFNQNMDIVCYHFLEKIV